VEPKSYDFGPGRLICSYDPLIGRLRHLSQLRRPPGISRMRAYCANARVRVGNPVVANPAVPNAGVLARLAVAVGGSVTPPLSWLQHLLDPAFHLVAGRPPCFRTTCMYVWSEAWSPWPVKTSMGTGLFFSCVFAARCRGQRWLLAISNFWTGAMSAPTGRYEDALGYFVEARLLALDSDTLPWPPSCARCRVGPGLPEGN